MGFAEPGASGPVPGRISLGPADNVFHLLLAAGAGATAAADRFGAAAASRE